MREQMPSKDSLQEREMKRVRALGEMSRLCLSELLREENATRVIEAMKVVFAEPKIPKNMNEVMRRVVSNREERGELYETMREDVDQEDKDFRDEIAAMRRQDKDTEAGRRAHEEADTREHVEDLDVYGQNGNMIRARQEVIRALETANRVVGPVTNISDAAGRFVSNALGFSIRPWREVLALPPEFIEMYGTPAALDELQKELEGAHGDVTALRRGKEKASVTSDTSHPKTSLPLRRVA